MRPDFDVVVPTDLTAEQAWAAVTHWPSHGSHVPLTHVRTTVDAGGLGDEFVGRTGVGPVGFDDRMRVTRWEPPTDERPGTCGITKLGRVVHGGATIRVSRAPRGAVVHWTERATVGPAWLVRVQAPLVSAGGALVFGRVLRRLLADAERRAA